MTARQSRALRPRDRLLLRVRRARGKYPCDAGVVGDAIPEAIAYDDMLSAVQSGIRATEALLGSL